MYHASQIEIPQRNGEVVFRGQGLKAGPSLAVIGLAGEMNKVAARLEKIPSLAYMRGAITIYAVDDASEAVSLPDVDDVLVLLDKEAEVSSNPLAALYWKILARAASLGIIAGRGVPAEPRRRIWH